MDEIEEVNDANDPNERQDTTESEIDLLLVECHDSLEDSQDRVAQNIRAGKSSVPQRTVSREMFPRAK